MATIVTGTDRPLRRADEPRLVVPCANDQDVAAAIRLAREQELPLGVRGGGCHPAGPGTGAVLDLRALCRVTVDPARQTVEVGGGASWAAVAAVTAGTGLGVAGLPEPAVGVAGSTLDGGFGDLRRAYGLVCDDLVGADVVLADGRRVTTSGDECPELLWGLRGGGGNFGAVTALRFRLRPVPSSLLAGTVWFAAPVGDATRLRWYRDFTADLAPEVSTRLGLYAAGHPAVPGPLRDRPVAGVSATTASSRGRAELDVAPIRISGPALADGLTWRPAGATGGLGWAGPGVLDSWYLAGLPDAVLDRLLERHAALPAGPGDLLVHHLGGAVARVTGMSGAAPHRAASYLVTARAGWSGPAGEERARAWLADTAAALRPHAVGGPHPGLCSQRSCAAAVYGPERALRLAALKARFDPDNAFAGATKVVPLR